MVDARDIDARRLVFTKASGEPGVVGLAGKRTTAAYGAIDTYVLTGTIFFLSGAGSVCFRVCHKFPD